MRDEDKTKEQLIGELEVARQRIAELNTSRMELRRGEDLLRQSAQRLEALLSATKDGIFEWDISSNRFEGNERLLAILGASRETGPVDMRGFLDRIHPDDIGLATAALSAHLERGGPYRAEFRLRRDDGAYVWVASTGEAIRDSQGRPLRMACSVADVNERKQTEEALRASEERYRSLVEHLRDAIFVASPGGKFLEVNPQASHILGYEPEELLRAGLFDLLWPDQLSRGIGLFGRLVEQGYILGEIALRRKDGTRIYAELNCIRLPSGNFLGSLRDITERRRAEEQSFKARKMESMCRVASGVAHELNNLLTPILGYAQLGIRVLPPDNNARGYLQEIEKAANRAADLAGQLLAFAGRQIIEPRVINLNGLLLNVDTRLRRLLGENIELVTRHGDDLWPVRVDPVQLEQVLLNLASNARDAMPEGGRLTIETRNVSIDQHYVEPGLELPPGEYVLLSVSDGGTGMTEEVMAHLFEPFFTTKEVGRGSGLGLAVCYGIVKQNGGQVLVRSEPGHGTTVRVYLPRARESAATSQVQPESSSLPRGSERLLVVEGEPSVRDLAARVLREQGYSVLEAASADEALRKARERTSEDIHLVLADVTMPHMGGRELAQQIRAIHPGIRVLYTIGYSDDVLLRQGVLEPGIHFIRKPFTPAVLARKVREVLDRW